MQRHEMKTADITGMSILPHKHGDMAEQSKISQIRFNAGI